MIFDRKISANVKVTNPVGLTTYEWEYKLVTHTCPLDEYLSGDCSEGVDWNNADNKSTGYTPYVLFENENSKIKRYAVRCKATNNGVSATSQIYYLKLSGCFYG